MSISSFLTKKFLKSLFFPAHNRGKALPKGLIRLLKKQPGFWDLPELPEIGSPLSNSGLIHDAQISISKKVNTRPSLYLKAGALHGCVLCQKDSPLIYVEDVGRHNAVDKIAGWMFLNKENANDKIFYTTGRLTSEMVIKTVQMGIPILISRSGFTESGVKLARQAGLTLIGRAKGKRMIIANGVDRVNFDTDIKAAVANEDVVSAQRSLIN